MHRAFCPKPLDNQGFTLIELIVVMVIIGLGSALVGPQVVKLHDKIMTQSEVQAVSEFIEITKIRAFARQQTLLLKFSEKTITVQDEKMNLKCTILQFTPISMTINGNGFTDIDKIRYQAGGEEKILDVPE